MKNKPLKFQIELESDTLTPVSDVIDKARVRIFYRGKNRNGGFITSDFANELVKTLPYTPIKGIVDPESGDFKGHGKKSDGKIFGIVPENPNCQWETHEDVDGIVRTYLVADVYLFTGLYESAKLIVGKGQSMELIPESITGEWIDLENEYFFVYKTGSFLGLQVLGKDIEPAFEGAAFFSLKADELDNLITETYGGIEMDKNKDKVEKDQVDVSVYEKQIAQLTEDNQALANELTSLREFKKNIERGEKEAILNEFSNSLDEDTINDFKDKLDEYSNESLEKELAYKLYLMNKDNVEEPTDVEEDAEDAEEEADKGKTEFSFYEVEKNEPKGDIEVLLEKYL